MCDTFALPLPGMPHILHSFVCTPPYVNYPCVHVHTITRTPACHRHQVWKQDEGPVKDLYNLGYNPQYRLRVAAGKEADVRVLLTRHITAIGDFAQNKEYITMHVYKGGERIHYPDDPVALVCPGDEPHTGGGGAGRGKVKG